MRKNKPSTSENASQLDRREFLTAGRSRTSCGGGSCFATVGSKLTLETPW